MTDAELHDLREKEARIRQLMADAMLKELDAVKRWQDIAFTPRTFWVSAFAAAAAALGAGAALFGAAIAFLKWVH